ncbi:MAG: metallophosphoesterase family protein [Nitrososphaerota archaeon]|nr:metallophosphoesterase family protein [Nitrososphaerota archaeon]MDG6919012.1 metallophosphoesterase family protein [Nitrososphaerota archaeon]
MKVAVISDIHGNLTALESILPEIKRADRIICLGDVAASGPQPHETIAFIRKAGWPCVLGNTDEMLVKSVRELYDYIPEGEREKMTSLDAWTKSEIDDVDRRFLSGFKPKIEFKTGKRSLLCYHGSPRSNTEEILPTTPEEELGKIFEGNGAWAYLGGHTHSQMVRKFGSSLIINPGSVGLPYFRGADGKVVNPVWAEYSMLTSSGDELGVELRRKSYRKRDLKEAVVKSGMPDPAWWLRDWVD